MWLIDGKVLCDELHKLFAQNKRSLSSSVQYRQALKDVFRYVTLCTKSKDPSPLWHITRNEQPKDNEEVLTLSNDGEYSVYTYRDYPPVFFDGEDWCTEGEIAFWMPVKDLWKGRCVKYDES